MICTVDVDIQSANPDFPLKEWKAFKGSPTSLRIRNVPRRVGAWDITAVNVKCVYPDNTAHVVAAVLTGCVWVATIPASDAVGFVDGGYSIEADGTDERGSVVTGYRLGEGKVTILDVAVSAHAVDCIEFMRVFDTKPDVPLKGDFALDTAEIYDGAEWRAFSAPADYPTVRMNAATGAAHAAETGNPHGTRIQDIDYLPSALTNLESNVQSASDVANSARDIAMYHKYDTANPHGTTAEQVGAYTKAEVDEKISQNAAHYLTAKVGGAFVPFATHAALAAAKAAHTDDNPQFWYGDDPHTPDKNDYCTILDDETHGHATTRYMFVGEWPDGFFRYQYTVNPTALTQAQWDALNSGITSDKVAKIRDLTTTIDATGAGKAADAAAVAALLSGITSQDITDFLNYKGLWESDIQYEVGDVVATEGAVTAYSRCLVRCKGMGVGDLEYWKWISDAGEGQGFNRLIDLFGEPNSFLTKTIVSLFADDDFKDGVRNVVKTDAETRTVITTLAEASSQVNASTELALKDRDCCLVAFAANMTFTFTAKEEGKTGLRSFEVIVTGCVKDGAVNWPAVTYRGDSTDLIPEDGDNHWTFAEQQDGSFAVTRHVANTFTIGE